MQAGEGCWRERVRMCMRTSSPMVAISVRSLYCVVVAISREVSNPEERRALCFSHCTRNSLAMTETAKNGVKTLRLSWSNDPDLDSQKPRVAIGRTGDAFVLVAADAQDQRERFSRAYISSLSVIVNEDPFPGLSMSGRQMIWVSPFDCF